jgi:hypothetical protein
MMIDSQFLPSLVPALQFIIWCVITMNMNSWEDLPHSKVKITKIFYCLKFDHSSINIALPSQKSSFSLLDLLKFSNFMASALII